MSVLAATPDALIAAASKVNRDWGWTGYRIMSAESPDWLGSVLICVTASDGSEFYIGATPHGQTVHHERREDCARLLVELVREERKA